MDSRHLNKSSTATDVASLFREQIHGKTVVITGISPGGLGEALCAALATQRPHHLILTARTPSKAQAVTAAVLQQCPALKVSVVELDLASFRSVRKAAAHIKLISSNAVDVLINNAGVMCVPEHTLTEDKFELHLAVNYMGPFLLARLLAEPLAAAKGRIVNVASSTHMVSPFRLSDPNFIGSNTLPAAEEPSKDASEAIGVPWTCGYSPVVAYAQSKTATILHAKAIAHGALSNSVQAFSVNPGIIRTNLWRHMPSDDVDHILASLPTKTATEGASTVLFAALAPNLNDCAGAYLEDCAVSRPAPHAEDASLASKLWKYTEQVLDA
ncbi:Retinol dehydrogenase [Penicillium canariense]|uniref:Retinol dehydrogenase n=1 Tax=Penicillium canariense TaxID=189055 RepID=A0A9W9IDP5_9EURO|nr:Retinol dehydrogenase [Penicillium canariense]KAJ5175703.1 Retinol dehydrogenase [Penicillium canariense]